MRETTFLNLLRGPDGRSLARAIAILMVFNLFAAGLHAGALAGGGGDAFILCQVPSEAGDPAVPGSEHRADCCLAGCGTTTLALAVDRAAAPDGPEYRAGRHNLIAIAAPPMAAFLRPRARAPPLSA